MTASLRQVRGWCPGALRPMQSGDGLIVRVRPRGHALTPADLMRHRRARRALGNGHIDLTRRANLQMRGVDGRAACRPCGRRSPSSDLLDASRRGGGRAQCPRQPARRHRPSECSTRARWPTRWSGARRTIRALGTAGQVLLRRRRRRPLPLDDERADIRLRRRARRQSHQLASGSMAGRRRVARRGDARRWLRRRPRSGSALRSARPARRDAHARPVEPRQAAASAGRRSDSIRFGGAPAFRRQADPLGVIDELRHGDRRRLRRALRAHRRRALRRSASARGEVGAREVRVSPWRSLYRACAGPRSGSVADRGGSRSRPHRRSRRSPACDRCLPRRAGCRRARSIRGPRQRAIAPVLGRMGIALVPRLGLRQGLRPLRPPPI